MILSNFLVGLMVLNLW